MIRSFADKAAEQIANGERSPKLPPDIHRRAAVLLIRLKNAQTLADIRVGNGDDLKPRADLGTDCHSIRINGQRRVYFRRIDGNAYDVEIGDKH